MKKAITLGVAMILAGNLFSQIIPSWVRLYNGPDNGSEVAAAVAASDSGYVYVTGTGFTTIKYSPSGNEKWSARYSSGFATSLAVDASGNVYVTGASDGEGLDLTTIKFDSRGSRQWVSKYNGMNRDDIGSAIAVDRAGNVYVTGASAGAASNMWFDYVTIKMSPSGDTLWTRRIGGPANERATALAVSDSGYVYVTGYADWNVGGGRYNYETIKYSPTGQVIWQKAYNGTGNDDDIPHSLAVDRRGNVYVTGQSWGNWYDDYATVKYNADGVQQWASRYNGPVNSYDKAYALKLDDAGNVYITGASGGTGINYDYATIKYNNSGVQQWISRYNGPANQDDHALALALDGSGNIFVTGYSDNAPAPGLKTPDYATVKYNSAGVEQWSARYNGPGNYKDMAYAITTDQSGNVYVTGGAGYYVEQGNFYDFATIRYDANYKNPAVLDSVTTITQNSAVVWGTVSAAGFPVTGRGAVYSQTDPQPKLGTGTVVAAGSGEGSFSVPITGLSLNKSYYMRVYAVGQKDTAYSAVHSFSTLPVRLIIIAEGNGVISKTGGLTNANGAMVWNGTEWIVNSTWAHKYFFDGNGGKRLKPVNVTLIPATGGNTITQIFQYQVEQRKYSYDYPSKNGGTYSYTGVEFNITDSLNGKKVVLRSRGTGTGLSNAYFDIYIENERSAGLSGQITAIRNDPAWFTYTGMSLEEALLQKSPRDSLTGEFSSVSGWYFLDIGGGGDLGPAGVGKSFIFHTAAFDAANANTADLGSSYPSDFAIRWMDGSGNINELDFLPLLISETFLADRDDRLLVAPDPLAVYPNPISGTSTVSFSLSAKSRASLKLFDQLGKVVMVLCEGELLPGPHQVRLDASGLPAGIYFCLLKGDRLTVTKKVIVTRFSGTCSPPAW